jgi:hypothetical protein
MHSNRLYLVAAGILVTLHLVSSTNAQSSVLTELYGQGVHKYFSCDYFAADTLLSQAIDSGSKDPRAYYFRGLAREMNGGGGDIDFEEGARLEVAGSVGVNVGVALTRIQGQVRGKIEKARQAARLQAALHRQMTQPMVPAIPPALTPLAVPVPAPENTDPFPGEGLRSEEIQATPEPSESETMPEEPSPNADEQVNPFDDEKPAESAAGDDSLGEPSETSSDAPVAEDPFSDPAAPAEVDPPAASGDDPFSGDF